MSWRSSRHVPSLDRGRGRGWTWKNHGTCKLRWLHVRDRDNSLCEMMSLTGKIYPAAVVVPGRSGSWQEVKPAGREDRHLASSGSCSIYDQTDSGV